jgi:hypothetical protein
MLPTSTPVQFEPDVLRASIQRLLDQPAGIYLTHYGRVEGAWRWAAVDGHPGRDDGHGTRPGARAGPAPGAQARPARVFVRGLRAHGSTLQRSADRRIAGQVDLELNAQGMAIWLDRR